MPVVSSTSSTAQKRQRLRPSALTGSSSLAGFARVGVMRDFGRAFGSDELVAGWAIGEFVEQPLAGSEEYWYGVDLELVDQPRPEVLLHRPRTTGDQHVPSVRCCHGLLERRLDPVGDEVDSEARASRSSARRSGRRTRTRLPSAGSERSAAT